MSRGFGKELAAEEVRVNVVRPWVIVTETRLSQHDDHLRRTLAQDRMGGPAEVAAVVLWLLSSDSSWVTGARLTRRGDSDGRTEDATFKALADPLGAACSMSYFARAARR